MKRWCYMEKVTAYSTRTIAELNSDNGYQDNLHSVKKSRHAKKRQECENDLLP